MQQIFPGLNAAPAAFAIAGMAAVFGGATRATFAAIVFAFEMTQSYQTILPVMFASVIADVVVNHLTHTSILTEQLRRRGVLVDHEYEADSLNMITVEAIMSQQMTVVPPDMWAIDLIERISAHDPQYTHHQAVLIVNEAEKLVGIVTRGDLLKAIRGGQPDLTVLGAGTENPTVAYPDESVREALTRMLEQNIGRLPVVSRQDSQQIVGYLSRANIMEAQMRRLREEREVETGWIEERVGSLMVANGSTHKGECVGDV